MNKLNLSIGVLLVGSLLVGCGSKSGTTGAAGTTGTAGTTGAGGGAGAPLGDSGPKATLASGTCKSNAFLHGTDPNKICVCQDATPTGCDTACVDLKTNDDNCGACGTKCAMNATCVAGVCGASPTSAVAKPTACSTMALASAGGMLYWTDTMNKKVLSMSTTAAAGTAPTVISSTETSPTVIAVRGTTAFWLDGMVIRKSAASGAPSVVYTSTVPVHGIAASEDGATVYFTVGDGLADATMGKVQKVTAAGGGTPTDVALEEHMGVPTALAVQGSLVAYPCDINGDVDIATIGTVPAQCWASPGEEPVGKMNIGCARIARSQGSLNQTVILAAGANVVWVDGHNLKMNELNATAVASNKSIASPDNNIHSIALGGTSKVFLVEFDDAAPTTGTVQKVAMAEGATLVPLARNINGPQSIAVDGKKVFFATADCEIQTLATGE
jgi:prepilin-type processing-associated H-X9-DG protein